MNLYSQPAFSQEHVKIASDVSVSYLECFAAGIFNLQQLDFIICGQR